MQSIPSNVWCNNSIRKSWPASALGLEYDWQEWDRQLERDVQAGKLAAMVQKALADQAAGE